MSQIGNALLGSIQERIKDGLNVEDAPAKPLNPNYAKGKLKKGLKAIRDMTWTGRTLRSMKVLSANENAGKIGMTDDRSDRVVHILNATSKQFGISPKDREEMYKAVNNILHTGSNFKPEEI